MISEGRLGEALSTDLKQVRAEQQELLELMSPDSLRSITTLLTGRRVRRKS